MRYRVERVDTEEIVVENNAEVQFLQFTGIAITASHRFRAGTPDTALLSKSVTSSRFRTASLILFLNASHFRVEPK